MDLHSMVMDAAGIAASGEQPTNLELKQPEANDVPDGNDKKKKATPGRLMRRTQGFCINCIARGLDCFDIIIKILGPIFMCLALVLFSFETYTYFVFVLPALGDDMPPVFQGLLTVLGVF